MNNKRANGGITTLSIALAVNAVLVCIKLYIGFACNSISILSDAMNNLGDTFACAISIFSFALLKKNSKKLSFGYGRMEYISDLFMAVIVCGVGAKFLYDAVERMILPTILTFTWRYFIVIGVTAVIKILLGFFFLHRNKTTQSGVLKASAIDSFADAGITAMVLIGYALDRAVNLRIDAVFGIAISVIMIINGVRLLLTSVKVLLGEKIDNEERKKITEIALTDSHVENVTEISLHKYGEYKELVVELVFTKDVSYDIISTNINRISVEIEKAFCYNPKICIARNYDETRECQKTEIER